MAFTVNDTRARQKIALLQSNVKRAASETVKDAASYLLGKVQNQIINSPGHAITVNPPPQPPHDIGGGRYVRRRTGTLVGSTKMRPTKSGFQIYQNESMAPYARKVTEWSERRYGQSYWRITVKTYGATVKRLFAERIAKAVEDADNLRRYSHQNPFPAT